MPDQEEETILYDNVADPYQLANIAADQPKVIQRLIRQELVPWLRRTGDPWLESQQRQQGKIDNLRIIAGRKKGGTTPHLTKGSRR